MIFENVIHIISNSQIMPKVTKKKVIKQEEIFIQRMTLRVDGL